MLERLPEVSGFSICVLMTPQIETDAVAKGLCAEILLEHAQHRRAFLIGQDIEHSGGFLGPLHWKLDGPCTFQTIDLHGRRARYCKTIPAAPLGLPGVDRKHLHERCEGFI